MFRRVLWTWPQGPIIKNVVPIAAIVLGVNMAGGLSVANHILSQNDLVFRQLVRYRRRATARAPARKIDSGRTWLIPSLLVSAVAIHFAPLLC